MDRMKLYGEPGWGSAIVEAQLDWYGIDYDFERVGHLFESAAARERVGEANPLAQIPTLVMPGGAVMTESAAITLDLAENRHDDSLVPAPGSAERARFLRWLLFTVANVYPTYTYGDVPERFVSVSPEAQAAFRETVLGYGKRLYGLMEAEAGSPWFLGERFSALDVYVRVMTEWRPGRDWFREHTPRLDAIASRADAHERLRATWQRNYEAG